jgi:hypothetical protein
MTRLKIMIMASFLSTIFGYGQNNKVDTSDIFPKESFSVIEANSGGKHVIGSINMAYKSYDKKIKYPWCLKISIGLDLKNLFDNGLPKDDESKVAIKLE